jgi:four helix bundle protein
MSIPTNIVEGRRQESEREFVRFLKIALNSGVELEYHLILARDIGAMSDKESAALTREVIEVRKMIHGLIKTVRASAPSAPAEAQS